MGIEIMRVTEPDAREHISRDLLKALPDWFGVPEALERYAKDCRALDTYIAFDGGSPIGFIALRDVSETALEVHVMGIKAAYHRRGIGRRFLEFAEEAARSIGKRFLCVMTLDGSHPDPGYARARAFYGAMGFLPLITLPELWGAENPCLLMVKPL